MFFPLCVSLDQLLVRVCTPQSHWSSWYIFHVALRYSFYFPILIKINLKKGYKLCRSHPGNDKNLLWSDFFHFPLRFEHIHHGHWRIHLFFLRVPTSNCAGILQKSTIKAVKWLGCRALLWPWETPTEAKVFLIETEGVGNPRGRNCPLSCSGCASEEAGQRPSTGTAG